MEQARHSRSPARTSSSSGGIQLTVTPKSSAFFSGEPLEFAITFRNTRPRVQQQQQQYGAPSTPHSASPSTSSGRSAHHAKHLSTSSLLHRSGGPSSAPPSRSAFAPSLYLQQEHHSSSNAPSPSRSYTDLSTFASPDNRSGSSSHIVLPERRGIIGTPLALASTSTSTSTPTTSPTQHLRRPASYNQYANIPPQADAPREGSLYPSKRLPSARHRKNDYSVASITDDPNSVAHPYSPNGAHDDLLAAGVSDLSSQLAGMAVLQQREGSITNDVDEEAVLNAQPFVEQYKRQGGALQQSRYPSINTDTSWRSTFRRSCLSRVIDYHS